MSECIVTREKMPMLLTEALVGEERERAHLHIESCDPCEAEWQGMRETWSFLGVEQDREVPHRVREAFLQSIGVESDPAVAGNVVSFWRSPAARWLTQAAAIVTLVGGAYFAGTSSVTEAPTPVLQTAQIESAPSQFTLAASRIVPASELAPVIDGAPIISNVRFMENQGREDEVSVSFDLTTNVTVIGSADERSFVSLMAYMLQDRSNPTPAQSDAIQWVRQTYGDERTVDPVIVGALANVLTSDSHEGVRLKVLDTLRVVRNTDVAGGADKKRDALIEALKNDPNPAIRIKAVEALTQMLSSENTFDSVTIETLREKASQRDENPYVRIKAAEALSQMNL